MMRWPCRRASPSLGEVLGARRHRVAHLARRNRPWRAASARARPAGDRARSRRAPSPAAKVEVGAAGQHERRLRSSALAEAAHLDDAAERRRMLEGVDAAEADVMGAPVRAVDHGIGFAGQFVMRGPCQRAGR